MRFDQGTARGRAPRLCCAVLSIVGLGTALSAAPPGETGTPVAPPPIPQQMPAKRNTPDLNPPKAETAPAPKLAPAPKSTPAPATPVAELAPTVPPEAPSTPAQTPEPATAPVPKS